MIKPAKASAVTDIQILTDKGHNYTVKATEVTDKPDPVDLKLFVEPVDTESLKKPPSLFSAAEVNHLKAKIQDDDERIAQLTKQSAADLKRQADAIESGVPHSLHFDYIFERDKPPFHLHAVWNDGKFSYIKADPEVPGSFYIVVLTCRTSVCATVRYCRARQAGTASHRHDLGVNTVLGVD